MSFCGVYHNRNKAMRAIQSSGSVMSPGIFFQLALGKRTVPVDENRSQDEGHQLGFRALVPAGDRTG